MSYHPTVLVADDDENILSAFRDFLKKEGCTMVAASNADEALRTIGHHRVDLLITDIRLGKRSGVSLFMDMKSTFPDLPVIVVTGYPELISESDLKAYGADFLFLKPLDLTKLREAVRKCLPFAHRDATR